MERFKVCTWRTDRICIAAATLRRSRLIPMTHSRSYRLALIHCSLPTPSGAKATSIRKPPARLVIQKKQIFKTTSSVSITQWEHESHSEWRHSSYRAIRLIGWVENLICVLPCIINVGKVIQKNQLDATITIYWSPRSAQHVSGNLLPIFRSVRLRFLQHMV